MSKNNHLKDRIQGKQTPAEAFIQAGLSQVMNETVEEIETNVESKMELDGKFDKNVLRKKVKQQSVKKARFEDEYKRLTVWVSNEAYEALQVLAANTKGEKTRIVTEAIMKYTHEYLNK